MVKGGKNMVKACYTKEGLKKGTWSAEEDRILASYVQRFGHWNWRALPKQAGKWVSFSWFSLQNLSIYFYYRNLLFAERRKKALDQKKKRKKEKHNNSVS